MKKWITVLLTLAMLASLLCGVSALAAGDEQSEDAPAEQTAEEAAGGETGEEAEEAEEDDLEGLDRLGEETEGCVLVKITNAAGTDIMAINIKPSDDWAWSEDIMADEDTFEVDETSVLCYTPAAAEDGEETEADEEAEAAEPVPQDLQIVFTDWTVGIIHNAILEDMQDVQLMRAWNSVPYLVYTSIATGEQVDTNEAEQAIALEEYYATQSSGSSSSSSSSGGGNTSGCIGGDAIFN